MSWASAVRERPAPVKARPFQPPVFERAEIDWDHLVTIDFETYYDDEYTLTKLSTSEYIRDERFKAQMMALKIGRRPTRVIAAKDIARELKKINWKAFSLLCHHTHFDGFILSHHYGVQPKKLYDTLSMARALHNSDIGAGLDEVSRHYGGRGKIEDVLHLSKGVRDWDPALFAKITPYCANDNEECFRIFGLMLEKMPADEIDLIDLTIRCFTEPLLRLDLPRIQTELEREIRAKRELLLSFAEEAEHIKLEKKIREACVTDEDTAIAKVKKLIGSLKFAELLRAEGIEPPIKISKSWLAKPVHERLDEDKWTFAFARTDVEFTELLEHPNERVRGLVEARISVKSTSNETRAGRFLKAGENGMRLPVYYKYAAALSLRWGGGNKMNMQNLRRGGELRKSIMAPEGYVIVVTDSGQIEARVNGWLWGQTDLIAGFAAQDQGLGSDVYCKFATTVYGYEIKKGRDDVERFVGKTAILGLGYQMGAERLQNTLALGVTGPPVYLDLAVCQKIVNLYRRTNHCIKAGWDKCSKIIEDMAAGRTGKHGPISWEKERLWLPNGLCLRYPGLTKRQRIEGAEGEEQVFDEWVYQRKGEEAKIYGGLLCENIVQALARIIVAGQMLAISKFARVVMTTHDEVVAICPAKDGEKIYKRMVQVMRTAPPWCSDLPLNAEGGFDVIYSK